MLRKVVREAMQDQLLDESQWRGLGIRKSRGWSHYAWCVLCVLVVFPAMQSTGNYRMHRHHPEKHVLLLRRPLGTDLNTGQVDTHLLHNQRAQYLHEFHDSKFKQGVRSEGGCRKQQKKRSAPTPPQLPPPPPPTTTPPTSDHHEHQYRHYQAASSWDRKRCRLL